MLEYLALIEHKIHTVNCNNCVHITNSGELNSQDNVIYNVNVIIDHKAYNFKSLSGRSWTQDLNRNIADQAAPSPNGKYIIGDLTKGISRETGGVFLPYEPTFDTERSFLGFHVDPSWGLDNEEDGTVGCHAYKTIEEFNEFFTLINDNNIETLIIEDITI